MNTGEGFPIAEEFTSLQGEGAYVGTPMYFIRLAGCNVGKPARALKTGPFPILQNGDEAKACTSWDGRIFPCDTDYSTRYHKTPDQLTQNALGSGLVHACITGGEPVIHKRIQDLIEMLNEAGIQPHVETSGTIYHPLPYAWVACSPKLMALNTMVQRADELKLLVDDDFDPAKLTHSMYHHKNVFLCPINGVTELNARNVERCKELVLKNPTWRVSFQAHKFYNWR